MAKVSNRSKLRELMRQHPNWTNKQYAEKLGQSADTVRAAINTMKRVARAREEYELRSKSPEPVKTKPVVPPKAVGSGRSQRGNFIQLI